jgi:parallel beta-helix repeat protein
LPSGAVRAWLLLLVVPASVAAGLGAAPPTGTGPRDLHAAFALPPVRDGTDSDLTRQLEDLQVGRRARHLGIAASAATRAWHGADATLASARIAGIVVSDRNTDVAGDPDAILLADRHGVREQRIDTRLHVPRGNVIAGNRIAGNASSGFYSDGGVENVIFDNLIEGNAKEGLCLDNGSTANVVAMNVVRGNGKRWGIADEALRLDFVDAHAAWPTAARRRRRRRSRSTTASTTSSTPTRSTATSAAA